MGGLKDKAAAHRLQETLLFAKQVIVSYAGLLLTMDMFPQVGLCCCMMSLLHSDAQGLTESVPCCLGAFTLLCRRLQLEGKASFRLSQNGVPGCLLNFL